MLSISVIAKGIGVVLVFLGALLTLITAIGLLALPDLLARMHAATKPQVLGLMLLSVGGSLVLQSASVAGILILMVIFQLITAPISAHMLSNAAFKAGLAKSEVLVVDEFSDDIAHAQEYAKTRQKR